MACKQLVWGMGSGDVNKKPNTGPLHTQLECSGFCSRHLGTVGKVTQ